MSMLTPQSPEKAPPHVYRPQGPLKRDINLMPANEASAKTGKRVLIALCILAALLAAGYFGILMPSLALKALEGLAAGAESQVAELAGVEADSMAKLTERDKKAQILAVLTDAGAGAPEPADIMAELKRACPEGVTLKAFTQDATGISVTGYAGNDAEVAELLVNMKKAFPQYPAVTLIYTRDAEVDEKAGWSREFQADARIQAVPEATATDGAAEGGDAQ